MNKVYDTIILGAGIAGASIAYELSKKDHKILVIDENLAGSGGSYAAGAFISPKISKPSAYKEYLNKAFGYTTSFYKENFASYFKECGLLKYPLNSKDIKRLKSYEEFIDIEYEKKGDKYFFKNAGILNTKIIKALLDNVTLKENYRYKSIYYDDAWIVDNFKAKHLIIATATIPKEFDFSYIKLKQIGGYRYDVEFDDMQKLNHYIHKDLSISCFLDDHIIIGATHIRAKTNLENDATDDKYNLIKKAKEFKNLQNLNILKHYTGYRVSTYDYFPIVGKLIDADKTLQTYPYIKNGSKVPSKEYKTFKNLYIHAALSSRGFVTAPYNAKLLCEHIIDKKEIDERLSPVRLFKKWARKDK